MENVVLIFNIILAIYAVYWLKEELGKDFYFLVLLVAFSWQNIFNDLTESVYISLFDWYFDTDKADVLYYGSLVVGTFVNVGICKARKNVKTLLLCSGLPLVLIYVLNSRYYIVWLLAVVLMAVVVVLQVLRIISLKSNGKKLKAKTVMRRSMVNINKRATILLVLAGIICLNMAFWEKVVVDIKSASQEVTLKEERSLGGKTLEKMLIFDQLSKEEKLGVMKEIIAQEAEYLGIVSEYTVVATDIADDSVLGQYESSKNIIQIDEVYLASASCEESIIVCMHELYHFYQKEIVDCLDWDQVDSNLKLVKEVKQWKEEQADYKSGSNSTYEEYAQQLLESSARTFSEKTAKLYMSMVEDN